MLFSRFDGELVTDVPKTRGIMPFIMRSRNESAVYFEQVCDLTLTEPWMDAWNASHDKRITLFHVVMAALTRVLGERPRLNRFVSGQRIFQRKKIQLSFAAKKKKLDDKAALATVKMDFHPTEAFEDMVARLHGDIGSARSDSKSQVDQELDIFLSLPRFVLDKLINLLGVLDFANLAPAALLDEDPMYCSVFVANLGSIKLDSAFHHLYEYGNCPLFCVVGKTEWVPAVIDGEVVPRLVSKLKFSFDERIEDGLYCALSLEKFRAYVEDPQSWLGTPDA